MVDTAAQIWRDYVTDGVPASGAKKPEKAKIREWGSWVEGSVPTHHVSKYGVWPDGHVSRLADAAHDAALVLAISTASAAGAGLEFGFGTYTLANFTIPGGFLMRGMGKKNTVLKVRTGQMSGSFVTITHTPTGPTFADQRTTIEGMFFEGNKPNATVSGIVMSDGGVSSDSGGQNYGYGLNGFDFQVEHFTGHGIYTNRNRNNGILINCGSRFNDASNVYIKQSFDWRIGFCAFGRGLGHCVVLDGAQYIHIDNSDVFGAGYDPTTPVASDNVLCLNNAGNITISKCSLDRAQRYAVHIISGTANGYVHFTIVDCLFTRGNEGHASQNAYINVSGPAEVRIVAPRFAQYLGAPDTQPAYFVRFAGAGERHVDLIGGSFHPTYPPYSTALTNAFSLIRRSGDEKAAITNLAGADTLSTVFNGNETLRMAATYTYSLKPLTMLYADPAINFYNTSGAVDEKITEFKGTGTTFTVTMMSDAGSPGHKLIDATRSGNTITAAFFNRALRTVSAASQANWFDVRSSATGSPVRVFPEGTDTNIGLNLETKGTGTMQFIADKAQFKLPAGARTPDANGDLVIERTSNTQVTIKLKGTDGTVRTNVLTLA